MQKYSVDIDILDTGNDDAEFRINGGDNLAFAVKSYSLGRRVVAGDYDETTPEGVEVTVTLIANRLGFSHRPEVHDACAKCGQCFAGACESCEAIAEAKRQAAK